MVRFAYAWRDLQWLAIFSAAISQLAATAKVQSNLLDNLDEALLNDIIQAYTTHEPSTCNSPASESATSFSFNWPGTNAASNWFSDFVEYEQDLFQAIMSHTDTTGDKSWQIRIGGGGNMYSHFVPDQYGETLPPQNHAEAPWIDEVQQSVSVNRDLNRRLAAGPEFCPGPDVKNKTQCKPYFIHQAGAYQKDSPTTDVPFFSPSLAKHCSGNSCIFASWGTQAHVETPFTSPVMYINKYTNCDSGIIEHTQMIHNFADPIDPISTALNVDQGYFNVGWGGVRSSTLPIALEPDPTTGALNYTDVNTVDYLLLCRWGGDGPGGASGRAERTALKYLGGYTSFVEDGLLVNQTISEILPYCRKASDPFCSIQNSDDWKTCMKASCNDADIAAGDVRMELKIAADSSPNCVYHEMWKGLISLQCNMHDQNFGQTSPNLQGDEPCSPWTDVGFFDGNTGEGLNVAYVKHWSWRPDNNRTYFAVYSQDVGEAINMVHAIFDNTGNPNPLPIEVRPTSNIDSIPAGYNPSALNAFTFVYGKGDEYEPGGGVKGSSRRRIGSTSMGVGNRDYTVFTINWYSASRLQPGSTYTNRGFYFNSDLASVKATADNLVTKTSIDEIDLELWSPRRVDIYLTDSNFVVLAASSAQGQLTICSSSSAALVCSGSSTPQLGHVPFFYTTCGDLTHFGSDPYHFTPPFGDRFPGHGNMTNMVRSYVCDGQDLIRPTLKLMGFFNSTDSGCTSLSTATYEETVCPPFPSAPPTNAPSISPTVSPSKEPTASPINPTNNPTVGLSKEPTSSPSKAPTENPIS